MFTTERIS